MLTVEVNGGRWGVAPASQHEEILVALASLIRAQRYDMALTILDNELENVVSGTDLRTEKDIDQTHLAGIKIINSTKNRT